MVTTITIIVTIVMGGDLQLGRLADRLVAGLSQPEINPRRLAVTPSCSCQCVSSVKPANKEVFA
eukprot:1158180-Pelagomonas_calceolata.AAC.7